MEVEVVRFNENDDNSMECIVIKKFYNTDDAHSYYTNWKCDEHNNDNVLILGEHWNKTDKTEIKIPDDYKYTYTYSVNLWDWENDDMIHSHNFLVYTKQK